jgi:DNA-binding transcriptional ArsR family regulator
MSGFRPTDRAGDLRNPEHAKRSADGRQCIDHNGVYPHARPPLTVVPIPSRSASYACGRGACAPDAQRKIVPPAWGRQAVRARPIGSVQLDRQLGERRLVSGTEICQPLVARAVQIPRGRFDPTALVEDPAQWLGLLVLDGFLAVGLDAGRAQISWLIGSDDLIRPWDMREISLAQQSSWRALRATRLALLDADFNRRVGSIPEITRALVGRATQTSHWLLTKSLIVSAPTIEERLLLLFAVLGERWGKVTPEGVSLELPLTHNLLARICGARRPTVTTALRSLGQEGLVESRRRGAWLLHETPFALAIGGWLERGRHGEAAVPEAAGESVQSLTPARGTAAR